MPFDFPFTESIIIYFGLTMIMLAFVILAIMMYLKLHRSFSKKEEDDKKPPSSSCSSRIIKLFLILLLIFTGIITLFFGAFIQSLTTFTKAELIAEVTIEAVNPNNKTMTLILVEKKGKHANMRQQFLLTGDKWSLQGDVITWDRWLNFLGLNTMYKLTRIGGQFTTVAEENSNRPLQYSLVPDEESRQWIWLYKNGYKLPFIDNVNDNSVGQYANLNKIFKVFVTPSGFRMGTIDNVDNN